MKVRGQPERERENEIATEILGGGGGGGMQEGDKI